MNYYFEISGGSFSSIEFRFSRGFYTYMKPLKRKNSTTFSRADCVIRLGIPRELIVVDGLKYSLKCGYDWKQFCYFKGEYNEQVI